MANTSVAHSVGPVTSELGSHFINTTLREAVERKGARYCLHSNLKIFSKAVVALSRLGSDLYLEPSEDGLKLKCCNKSKSAYGVFLFMNDFFSEVDYTHLGAEDSFKMCRISMKCALTMFKGLQFVDKNFVSCEIWVDPSKEAEYLRLQLAMAYDIVRSYDLNLLETPPITLRSTFDKSNLNNCTIAFAEYLSDIVKCIAVKAAGEELIICATENSFVFKNFVESDEGSRKIMQTFANVPLDVNVVHNVKRPTEISFSLKEFMAILTFAQNHSTNVSLHYDLPGSPFVTCLEGNINYTSEFILATVETQERQIDGTVNVNTTHVSRSQNVARIQSQIRSQHQSQANGSRTTVPEANGSHIEAARASTSYSRTEAEVVAEPEMQQALMSSMLSDPLATSQCAMDNGHPMDVEVEDLHGNTSAGDPGASATRLLPAEVDPYEFEDSPLDPCDIVEHEEQDDLPDTPPPKSSSARSQAVAKPVVDEMRKKRNNSFRRAFLGAGTQHLSQLTDRTILADNSDED